MKQRFSSLDVKVIAHELSTGLVSLRLSNIYDLSSKILLFKFAKPDNKKQLLIDSGFRCHLTDFARTTAAAPSLFVQKLRKVLKTRRLTAVSQIGTDRIIELQFSDGLYRIYLEFFAGGNVILTDADLKILTLLRFVPEGEGQEPQRPGLTYSLENRQNYGGVPPLTKDRLKNALQSIIDKNAASATAAKKIKKKPGDELRKGLAVTINELPPILLDHAMKVTGFDTTVQPATVRDNEELLDHLLRSLEEGRKLVEAITSSETCKGYIFAKKRPGAEPPSEETQESQQPRKDLLYDDFHPFLPRQFEEDPGSTVLSFDSFGKTVDEFFSSIEGQKLESRLTEREAAAKRKLEAARADQEKRIEGLQAVQTLNVRKASAIEANVERVQEAMDAVNGLIAQGMDWEDIGKLIDREKRLNNPVAAIVALPLKLHENTITLLLGEAENDEEDEQSDTDSSDSEDDDDDTSPSSSQDTRLHVDINLGISPFGNARDYYDERKVAAVKEQKTIQQSQIAIKSASQKIEAELKKGLKTEKPTLQPIRRQMWFEKFLWFLSTDGYLVLGGKDLQQNELLYRKYLKKGDIYVHADLHGAASVIIKNIPHDPDAPIPPSTLSQAGSLSVCSSSAWDSKASMSAWWVTADQVSKAAPTGEFLPAGSFMVRGKKNFLPASQLVMGFALLFRVSEESKGKHVKHRLYETPGRAEGQQNTPATLGDSTAAADASTSQDNENEKLDDSESDEGATEEDDFKPRANPLQPLDDDGDDEHLDPEKEAEPSEQMDQLTIADEVPPPDLPEEEDQDQDQEPGDEATEDNNDTVTEADTTTLTASSAQKPPPSTQSTQSSKKAQQPKRGQRGKAKKIANKYKDQDDDDREAIEALIGSAAGRQRAEAEAQAKADREAALALAAERRRAQKARLQRETAEHEEVRRVMLEEGIEVPEDTDGSSSSLGPLDSLVGNPLPGDEILEVIAFCAPYAALGKCKYKVKLQPGNQKKGKAVKEILEGWKAVSSRKGVLDEMAQDRERMWPREVELLKAVKGEDVVGGVPMRGVKVLWTGGGGGGGGGGGSGGGGAGKKGGQKGGSKGGKGKKK
ncbi:fibronectin-binding protein A N-terminus-domain-containing protein [Astrocystis sublimbata]|nr:fibronectin-binding protein A N-terminus-domain-containing protein [Astrocystis sublimbata]